MSFAHGGAGKLFYETHGDAGGTPLVLVMGVAGSCQGWLPFQVPAFAPRRPVLIYDHRGVAESEDDGKAFTTADLATDLRTILDTAGIERADVLGAFMGGMVAQEFALAFPERTDKLVLVGTYARPDAKRRLLLEQWKEMARADASQDLLMRNRLLWTLHEDTLDDAELVNGMIDFFRRDGPAAPPDVFERQCDACLAHDTLDRLGGIERPTLIVCGEHDALTPPRLHRTLSEGLPDGRLVTLSQAAHLVAAERAERFNQLVEQFLDDER